MDLSTLRTRAKELILDIPSELTDAMVDTWIQDAQAELEDEHRFFQMQASVTKTTTVATRALGTKPSDFLDVRERPYFYDGAGADSPIDWLQSTEEVPKIYSPHDTTEDGPPRHVVETESGFDVYPLPDGLAPDGSLSSDGEYRVVIPYWKRLASLTADDSTNWFSENAAKYLFWYAAAEGNFFNQNGEQALTYKSKAESEKKRLIRADKRRRIPKNIVLSFRRDARASIIQPRTR